MSAESKVPESSSGAFGTLRAGDDFTGSDDGLDFGRHLVWVPRSLGGGTRGVRVCRSP